MNIDYKKIKELIDDAERILIGVGNECSIKNLSIDYKDDREKFFENLNCKYDTENEYIYDNYYLAKAPLPDFYKKLSEIVNGKEYFVISSNYDGALKRAEFKKDRIVSPCGDVNKLQCKCCNDLYDLNEYKVIEDGNLSISKCPNCNEQLFFNVRNKDTKDIYNETGYINQWQMYTKWLSTTLNKKLLIFEFGENFNNPNLFRWPFEKVTFFNQKANLIRVNTQMYQVGEEIKDKAMGINENVVEFINHL